MECATRADRTIHSYDRVQQAADNHMSRLLVFGRCLVDGQYFVFNILLVPSSLLGPRFLCRDGQLDVCQSL